MDRFDQALGHPGADRTPADALREGRQYAASCQRRSGKLLGLMGTEYAARDMDRLRAAVGDEQLSYLGLSYGTYLGAVYADLFPSRVRAVTLDGAIDPFQYGDDYLGILGLNYRASERAVDAVPLLVLRPCHRLPVRQRCRRAGPGQSRRRPGRPAAHEGKGRRAGGTNGYTVLYFLYLLTSSGREAWPETGKLLAEMPPASRRSPTATCSARRRRDQHRHRVHRRRGQPRPGGLRPLRPPQRRHGARLGPALAYGPPSYDGANAAVCSDWPVHNPPSDWRGDFRAQGADPVLVVGSVGDPSTPYAGAVALAATLDERPAAHRVRWPRRHAHLVLRQLLHQGEGRRLPWWD